MRIPFLAILLFCSSIVFSQTKEDILACLELISEQDDFQPAYENDVSPSGAAVFIINRQTGYKPTVFQKITSEITADDFRDFTYPIEIYDDINRRADEDEQSIIQYCIRFYMGGTATNLRFSLTTISRNDNLQYEWSYNLAKNDDEWVIEGQNLNKRKI